MARDDENIDKTQHAGEDSVNRTAWIRWSIPRLQQMKALRAGGLFDYIENDGGKSWRNVVEHSLTVNVAAVLLARQISKTGYPIDVQLVDTASLLHDIAKRRDKENKVSRDEEKRGATSQLLLNAGYTQQVVDAVLYTGRVPEIYLNSDEQTEAIANKPVEQLITAYVDARTRNTEIVGLEAALEGNVTKNPKDEDFYRNKWYPFYHQVEARLFTLTSDFQPADLNNTNALALVQENV